jgi:hypothetical protein
MFRVSLLRYRRRQNVDHPRKVMFVVGWRFVWRRARWRSGSAALSILLPSAKGPFPAPKSLISQQWEMSSQLRIRYKHAIVSCDTKDLHVSDGFSFSLSLPNSKSETEDVVSLAWLPGLFMRHVSPQSLLIKCDAT